MASSESDVYDEIKKGAKALGGRVTKHSDRHVGGVPDLSITLPRDGQFWNEIKFDKMPVRPGTPIKVNLSQLQRNWIRAEQKAGGKAGWTLCVKVRAGLWFYWTSTDPDVRAVKQGTHHFVRKNGELTNVGRMADIIVRGDYGPNGATDFKATDRVSAEVDGESLTDGSYDYRSEGDADRPGVLEGVGD